MVAESTGPVPPSPIKVADHESASPQARSCHDVNFCPEREGTLTGQPGIVKCERVIEHVRGLRNPAHEKQTGLMLNRTTGVARSTSNRSRGGGTYSLCVSGGYQHCNYASLGHVENATRHAILGTRCAARLAVRGRYRNRTCDLFHVKEAR